MMFDLSTYRSGCRVGLPDDLSLRWSTLHPSLNTVLFLAQRNDKWVGGSCQLDTGTERWYPEGGRQSELPPGTARGFAWSHRTGTLALSTRDPSGDSEQLLLLLPNSPPIRMAVHGKTTGVPAWAPDDSLVIRESTAAGNQPGKPQQRLVLLDVASRTLRLVPFPQDLGSTLGVTVATHRYAKATIWLSQGRVYQVAVDLSNGETHRLPEHWYFVTARTDGPASLLLAAPGLAVGNLWANADRPGATS